MNRVSVFVNINRDFEMLRLFEGDAADAAIEDLVIRRTPGSAAVRLVCAAT